MIQAKLTAGIAGLVLAGMAYGSETGLIRGYQDAGGGPFSATEGRAAWMQEHRSPDGEDIRSCSSCHGNDLNRPGRHIRTGKPIDPMALSVNPERLTDPEKVEKWFRRNCRWTLGRECTPQEKGDFVRFIISQ